MQIFKHSIDTKVLCLVSALLLLFSCGPKMKPVDKSVYEPRQAELRKQVYDREDEFNKMDTNSDDYLSMNEYNGSEKLFRDIDSDTDNRLSKNEAKFMMTFAEIPSGEFMMGFKEPIRAFIEPATDCNPQHKVKIDEFKMSATEVTNAQYVMYLNSALQDGIIDVKLKDIHDSQIRFHYPVPIYAVFGAEGTEFEDKPYVYLSPVAPLSHHKMENGLLLPEHPLNISWIDYLPEYKKFVVREGFEDWPVCSIKWWGAMAYANYYGLSIPTEAEWEYVAKGGKNYMYPTHDGKNDGKRSNYACYNVRGIPESRFKGTDSPEDYIGFRIKVGSYPPNPFGVYDMAGNVWEWCYDWYDENFYQYCIDNNIARNPLNLEGEDPPYLSMQKGITGGPVVEFSHDSKVCRGGSWNYHEVLTRSEYRFRVYQFIGNDHFGFRVVYRPESVVFNGKN